MPFNGHPVVTLAKPPANLLPRALHIKCAEAIDAASLPLGVLTTALMVPDLSVPGAVATGHLTRARLYVQSPCHACGVSDPHRASWGLSAVASFPCSARMMPVLSVKK